MTRSSRKNRPPKRQKKTQEQETAALSKQQNTKNFVVFVIVAILAAIPFSLGKYFEFNYPDPFDSGGYVYSAKHILDGAKIGVEEKPSARLGTLLVNILGVWLCGFNETGPKLIQTLLQAIALVFMFIAMRKLFGILAAAVGVIVASVYLSAPLIAKFGNVKEQYMIAFMVMGMSCFVLRQLDGKWWWAVLAGAFLSWAPLFKETGTSAIGALGLFVIAQPVFKHRTWKQTVVDILLLLTGVAAAIGPLYVWIIGWDVQLSLPYSFVWKTLAKFLPISGGTEQAKAAASYVGSGRKLVPFSEQWPIVLRYYGLLILPITLAAGSIITRIVRMFLRVGTAEKTKLENYERFVLLFAVWWLLDMAFVWISPHSYEQYYLPLNASAAMLGGYLIALYCDKVNKVVYKTKWLIVGVAGLVLMIALSWHIFFGIEKSPYSGGKYGEKRRGYAQRLNEINLRRKENLLDQWEILGEYIRLHSEPTDKIYVWGWYPGIYVKAQRFSSAARAFSMPRPSPSKIEKLVEELLTAFEREPPKFIVDSRKLHIPLERPPYEIWPIAPKGFMDATEPHFLRSEAESEAYDTRWSNVLRENFGEDEALRYEALKPFREFVMKNYRIVQMFGPHVLFQLKDSVPDRESS